MQKKQFDTLYSVDIGNTRVHCGIINTTDLTCLSRLDFPVKDLEQEFLPALQLLNKKSSIPLQSPLIIAGGTEKTYTIIQSILIKHDMHPTRFRYTTEMPFSLHYDSIPGADRIADTLYCTVAFAKRDYIIIGAGTAITINLITGNQFTGGVILPGVSTQLKSLNDYAPVLPRISPDGPTPLPGSSTETCIRSGVLYGISGAIQRIISEYTKNAGESLFTFATGGDWPYISNFIDTPVLYNPDITLIGVALGQHYIHN